ncbi:MAG: riboflavin synthase [Bdellovibrio sp. CG10_big_fil_rev_8_21_14_0_10_47_8]|nr:MAG: riboflavin synthase [Bdellovibrio sp. CG10_big_fil_rev_8_21_14_0_10_47_8]
MFSGIVESVQPILSSQPGLQKGTASSTAPLVRIKVKKPTSFNDLKVGDSIAVDGICLTVEEFDADTIAFAMAAETLRVLRWSLDQPERLIGKRVNLERSLRFGDRIHGHLVTGHVDSLALVRRSESSGENHFLDLEVAESALPYLWNKGSITINGVSLTVNEVRGALISVCLIPETLKRTNLGEVTLGSFVNIEPDYMAKAVVHSTRAPQGQASL